MRMSVITFSVLMLTSLTVPVLSRSAAFFSWVSRLAYSAQAEESSSSPASCAGYVSTAIPSNPITLHAMEPSTSRTTDSRCERKDIPGALVADDVLGRVAAGGLGVHAAGPAAVDGERELHRVRLQ